MRVKSLLRVFGSCAFFIVLQACASNPSLKDLSQDVDRGYTLPEGAGRVVTGYGLPNVPSNRFEYAITDHLAFTIDTIAPGLRLALIQTDWMYLGIAGNYLGIFNGASSELGINITPFTKLRINGNYGYFNAFFIKADQAQLSATWDVQLGQHFALGPKVTYARLRVGSDFVDKVWTDLTRERANGYLISHFATATAHFLFNFSEHLDLEGEAGKYREYGNQGTTQEGFAWGLNLNFYF